MGDGKSAAEVGMTLKIDPKEISRALVEAVIQSDIGPKIRGAVEKALEEKRPGIYGNVIETAVNEKVSEIIKDMVGTTFAQQVKDRALQVMGEMNFLDKGVQKVLDKMLGDIARF